MANTYDIGDVVRITGTIAQGVSALDPTTVSIVVRRPDGIKRTFVYLTDAEVVRTAQGAYRLDYTTTLAGPHWYRWISTGTGAAAGEERFVVAPAHATE